MFQPNPGPSSVNYDLDQGKVTLYVQKRREKDYSGGNDGGATRKVMCDNKQACMY